MTGTLDPIQLREELKKVIDPEIFENIVDLGLVYDVQVAPEDRVKVMMTLTTPHCPMGPEIIENVEKTVLDAGAKEVDVNIVWEPMWTPDMMTDELKRQLGILEDEPQLKIDPPSLPPPRPKKKKKGLLGRLLGW